MRCNYCGLDDHDHHCLECGRSLVGKHPCECTEIECVDTLKNIPAAMDLSGLDVLTPYYDDWSDT